MNKKILLPSLITITLILGIVTSAPVADYQLGSILEQTKPWHDVIIRRFYGPWSIVRKRDDSYIDYNDYGASIPPAHHSNLDLINTGQPVPHIYSIDSPLTYDTGLSELKSIYNLSPVGLAVFTTGIRSGDWLNGNIKNVESTEFNVSQIDDDVDTLGDTVSVEKGENSTENFE